jgi:hypothetical protein
MQSVSKATFALQESRGASRRLEHLREQLLRENRRSAAPFAHPLAARGPLWTLREQIRDVSRIADAVAINADSASEARLTELCSDLKRLLQTQQRWTERLENQIWRLESQANLMKRLQQVLLHGSPGTDQLWELCEIIARETQAVPNGLLLLPEPGHRLTLAGEGINHFAANSIEQARLTVFAAMTILPDIRGADLVAGTFHFAANSITQAIHAGPADEPLSALLAFAQQLSIATPLKAMSTESLQLLHAAARLASQIDQRSLTAADCIVPPSVVEFYGPLAEQILELTHSGETPSDETDQRLIRSMCVALGLKSSPSSTGSSGSEAKTDGDERLVLTHKLRWHDGQSAAADGNAGQTPDSVGKRVRRPNFLKPSGETPRFSVFAE